jgi:hypothetical protein
MVTRGAFLLSMLLRLAGAVNRRKPRKRRLHERTRQIGIKKHRLPSPAAGVSEM